MSEETNDTLHEIYDELKKGRDEILLKLHLGGMELRDKWQEVEPEWEAWTQELGEALGTKSEELEQRLRDAGGEDLRRLEVKTRKVAGKLKQSFSEIVEILSEK
jgi:hypothetical protein